MAISLTPTSATLASEYAATSINFGRSLQANADGHLVPVYSAQVAYSRQDFVVDEDGNKTNIVQRTGSNGGPMMSPQPDPYQGWVSLTHEQLLSLGAAEPAANLLEAISDAADALIQADLVKRGLV